MGVGYLCARTCLSNEIEKGVRENDCNGKTELLLYMKLGVCVLV